MAELEQIFLQNAAVAAALLGDEAARPLRKQLLREMGVRGNINWEPLQEREQDVLAVESEPEGSAGASTGPDSRPERTLLEAMAEEEKRAEALEGGGAERTSAAAENSAGKRRRTAAAEKAADTATEAAPLPRERAEETRFSGIAAKAEEKTSARETLADALQPGQARERMQWETASDHAQSLLEQLREEGLWSGEAPIAAQRLARTPLAQENRAEASRRGTGTETLMQTMAEAQPLPRAFNALYTGNGEFRRETDGKVNAGNWNSAENASHLGAEPSTNAEAAQSGRWQAPSAGAGGRTASAGGSGSRQDAFSLPEGCSAEISGRDRMAEISRFFERDARRYGQ